MNFDKRAQKKAVLAIYATAVVTAVVVFITQVFFDIPLTRFFSAEQRYGRAGQTDVDHRCCW